MQLSPLSISTVFSTDDCFFFFFFCFDCGIALRQDVSIHHCQIRRQIFRSCTSSHRMGSDFHSSTSPAKTTNILCKKKKKKRGGIWATYEFAFPKNWCLLVRDFNAFTEWKKFVILYVLWHAAELVYKTILK